LHESQTNTARWDGKKKKKKTSRRLLIVERVTPVEEAQSMISGQAHQ
jgi:hypothetical protein